jgi:hypothetical protein
MTLPADNGRAAAAGRCNDVPQPRAKEWIA